MATIEELAKQVEEEKKKATGRRKEAVAAGAHQLYYLQQEQQREKIMAEREKSRIDVEADYTYVDTKLRHFVVFKKDKPTEEQVKAGKEYRVKFTVSNTECFFDCQEKDIDKKINEVYEKFSGAKNV